MTKASTLRTLLAATLVASGVACTVHQSDAPPTLTGPSDLSLRLDVTATPDTISQDGGSQSSIRILASGPNGQPIAGLSLRIDTVVGGVPQDFGTLSARTVVTGSDGVARVVFTAPPASPPGANTGTCAGLPGNCISITATPTGNDFTGFFQQSVTIRLVPTGVILPPASTPTAQFVFSPASPTAGSSVAFDGSSSCAGSVNTSGGCAATNNVLTTFAWNFGDGSTGTGTTVSHTFAAAATSNVTLTVTNDRGLSASTTRQVTVAAGTPPTATFVFGPTPVLVGVQTNFDASGSKAATGRTIVQYQWNWGDGDPLERRGGPMADHDFNAAGTYQVVLTVTDDTGLQASATQSVSVASGAPTATMTISKTGGNSIIADGNGSTAVGSATITDYTFSWGDNSAPESGTAASRAHTYALPGTYTVRLTVRDSLGRTGTTTASVTVP